MVSTVFRVRGFYFCSHILNPGAVQACFPPAEAGVSEQASHSGCTQADPWNSGAWDATSQGPDEDV
jgi:hypothetical protein